MNHAIPAIGSTLAAAGITAGSALAGTDYKTILVNVGVTLVGALVHALMAKFGNQKGGK